MSVKKGKVSINGKDWLSSYPPKPLKKNDKIVASNNAILLFRKGSSIVKISCPCKDLSYSSISKKLTSNGVKVSYSDIIFNKPLEAEAKKQHGGVSRGNGSEIDTFAINISDSAWVMNHPYFIEWKSSFLSKTNGPIQLFNKGSENPIKESTSNKIEINNLVPGWYNIKLKASVFVETNDIQVDANYIFYIPTEQEKIDLLQEIDNLKKELVLLGEDITEIILGEFVQSKRLYGLKND
jgi:hypothetical protein